ncbi:MAG: HAMP domain-containing sensor histidine kinase [Xanthomonadales bacterium]|jgi:hypothetical protein|nr:HAMP domain-containing sensor histidine kinase [Xanthomonadales bacterium]
MGQSSNHANTAVFTVSDLSVLRHELANVLNGLTGMAGLLRSAGLPPEQERWLDAIEQSAQQMQFLVHSEMQPGGECVAADAPVRCKFNGVSLLERVITAHTPLAGAKGLKLLLLVSPDLPVYWRGHERLLRQLLDNLLGNAIKFTDSGRVSLEARPAENRALKLLVRDTGTGIPAADRERVFEAGARGGNAVGRPGRGLGLALCRKIAGLMGGRISCAPAAKGGTRFEVTLPGMTLQGDGRRLPSLALSSVSCTLQLERPLGTMTANFLERIGVSWHHRGTQSAGKAGARLLVSISECRPQEKTAWPGLVLRVNGYPEISDPVLLRPPILESALEQCLLRLALAWRWHGISPGDRRG